ncbi:MAG: histidine phosphatase family protein [Nanoarchaeota archaeon]|nr:histidine phosphatase family protein [Nanoarchaeota archaeon]
MVVKLEIILMRHNESYDNKARVIQGQRDTPPVDGNQDRLYETAKRLVDEEIPIDAVYTSDLKRAKDHARLIADFLRARYLELRPGHTIDYFENDLLRERARGPLEGARYAVDDSGLTITLEEGKTIALPHGKTTQTLKLPQFQSVDEYLWSLDDPNLGEDRPAIAERIVSFRDRYLKVLYERRGGKILIMGHSHWINPARNLLVDGDVASRPFEPMANLGAIRLIKENGQRHYREFNCSYTGNPGSPVGTRQ